MSPPVRLLCNSCTCSPFRSLDFYVSRPNFDFDLLTIRKMRQFTVVQITRLFHYNSTSLPRGAFFLFVVTDYPPTGKFEAHKGKPSKGTFCWLVVVVVVVVLFVCLLPFGDMISQP